MISVWSRVGRGSITVTLPWLRSPAIIRAVLTWALAAESVQVPPVSRVPRTERGKSLPPSRPSIRAPRFRRGSTTRLMGRRLRLSSPVMTEKAPGIPERSPHSSRAVVPEFPASRVTGASQGPFPRRTRTPESPLTTEKPSCSRHRRVLLQSSPFE
jgi:hypothetical protein